jgi:hypothetical protein
MKRILNNSLCLCISLFIIIAVLQGCKRQTDEELLAQMSAGVQAGTFSNQDQAIDAVGELAGRGNAKAKDPQVVDMLIATGASLLDNNADWTNPGEARKVYDAIKKYDDQTIIEGLVRKVISDEKSRVRVLFLGVKLGIGGTEERLNKILDEQGDKKMAEDFLNSGSQALYEGGKRWAQRHGYTIITGMGSHRVQWGHF